MNLDVSIERALRVLEPQVALTTAEERHEDIAEILAHLDERLEKQLARCRVDLANGLLQRGFRRIQVVALSSEEFQTLRFFLVLLDCQRVHRPERVQLFAHHARLGAQGLVVHFERLEAEWKKPVDELLAGAETLELDDETLRQEAALVREQLDALGPVNPLAIEEHEEETKRLEFLTTQRDDLNSAKNSLQQAIREIDTTARELFLQTFVQVRENFRNIFMTLFGGGECDLRLENPESPLDGDIEIHASPRGKRTQRIHLLSSGEKALVALSLLFGIFLTKPSPFCLLDEVDAPLDDQNIGHFVRMLNRFKSNTQFIVITHNPRTTTEAADAVYGVTMQEPGVSSLVSVRMRGRTVDETITPAHPAHTPQLRDEPDEAADTASLIA